MKDNETNAIILSMEKGRGYMKLACIDDNKEDLLAVKRIIEEFNEIDVDYFYDTTKIVEDCHMYDAIITDINVPIENGLIIGKKLRDYGYDKPIIFISWHPGFEHESFVIHPFGFIKKEYLDYEMKFLLYDLLQEYHRNQDTFEYVDRNGGKIKIYAHEILYFERYKNSVAMYLKKGIVEYIRCSLKTILGQEMFGFHLMNKSVILNFYNVQKYPEKGEFIMYDGTILFTSRSKKNELHKEYLKFKSK